MPVVPPYENVMGAEVHATVKESAEPVRAVMAPAPSPVYILVALAR